MSKVIKRDVCPSELKGLLRADFALGKLFWRHRPLEMFPTGLRAQRSWNSRFEGKEAFTAVNSHGYRVGCLYGRQYTAHRVIWCLAYGVWPQMQVDHISGSRLDNALCNLRLVTNAENHMNTKRPANNTSGEVGVYFEPRTGAWVTQIYSGGSKKHLGTFRSKLDAVAARKAAEGTCGYHPNHGRKNG